jgi:hypothetical protein
MGREQPDLRGNETPNILFTYKPQNTHGGRRVTLHEISAWTFMPPKGSAAKVCHQNWDEAVEALSTSPPSEVYILFALSCDSIEPATTDNKQGSHSSMTIQVVSTGPFINRAIFCSVDLGPEVHARELQLGLFCKRTG